MSYDMNTRPFFVHPFASNRRNHGVPARQRREVAIDSPRAPDRRPRQTLVMREMMAETKVTLATHQLSEQVKESKWYWGEFRDEYLSEVKSVKPYVGGDILQQIWRKKVASKVRHKRGGKDSDQQFDIQTMKLESCLSQLDEATQLLAKAWSSDSSIDYDSRHHHLAKVQAAGNLVVSLSKKALRNESACTDLLEELAEIEKLIDPKGSAASTLHSYDKRQSQNTARSGRRKTEGSSSNRPENEDTNNQTEHDSNGWQDSNEHEDSNWPDNNEVDAD